MERLKLDTHGWDWQTADEFQKENDTRYLTIDKFLEVTDLLLENPNFNSSHLFRADILHDSAGQLKTNEEKAVHCQAQAAAIFPDSISEAKVEVQAWPSPRLNAVEPYRTVTRRLVPRNPNIDKPLDQSCCFYLWERDVTAVVYLPHVEDEADMPWYHPCVKALAYVFEPSSTKPHRLSLHWVHFSSSATTNRLTRTFSSLLNIFLRLSKHPSHQQNSSPSAASAPPSTPQSTLKDTILPQHLVQDTYTALKRKYAPCLISNWVEATPPEKHVFEDLSIAAFLICLWRTMYASPVDNSSGVETSHSNTGSLLPSFPGFIDIACGNGLLIYILTSEGYPGHGIDARQRKTWATLNISHLIEEAIVVPQPFLDSLREGMHEIVPPESEIKLHNGTFSPGTFIISNHADELTPWTPLLGTLSCPANPLPFLAIPCCSHNLSGARHRYTPPKKLGNESNAIDMNGIFNGNAANATGGGIGDHDSQPATGDLQALRANKIKAGRNGLGDDKSQYACLTRKVVELSEELGIETGCTLMRIPSTRNIGIVGRRRTHPVSQAPADDKHDSPDTARARATRIVERECNFSGGLNASARTWIERAVKLHGNGGGKGSRGKVNLGYKPSCSAGPATPNDRKDE